MRILLLHCAVVAGFQLPWSPPPPPPPPPPEDFLEQDLLTLAALLGCLLLAIIYYVKSNWTAWFDKITLATFKDVDRDGSGTIDREETCAFLPAFEVGSSSSLIGAHSRVQSLACSQTCASSACT